MCLCPITAQCKAGMHWRLETNTVAMRASVKAGLGMIPGLSVHNLLASFVLLQLAGQGCFELCVPFACGSAISRSVRLASHLS